MSQADPGRAQALANPRDSIGRAAAAHRVLVQRLLHERIDRPWWVGELASSPLSTATAVIALARAARLPADAVVVQRGLRWLASTQNADGGWGDTTLSASNISTTALCWAAFGFAAPGTTDDTAIVARCEAWLTRAAGGLEPSRLADALGRRYGEDRTFSAPILTALAIAGRLGRDPWRHVPQLPFELAACPPRVFQFLQLPVVSYALPALIAIGQVRHHHRASRNALLRVLRRATRRRTGATLRSIQPTSGGYLEATPLTSFVVMSLASMAETDSPVLVEGLRFLRESMRPDGSWPVDTNLSTWVTTLSVNALAASCELSTYLDGEEQHELVAWLLAQHHRVRHPYTQAPPGGWAWTPLPGGVPDADDTAGALLALAQLAPSDARVRDAAEAGVCWLLELQNRDGGVPTFCRGWGALPFDRSTPDLTAHALLAWRAWFAHLSPATAERVTRASERAVTYLTSVQRHDGAWVPLWFGNEQAPGECNPTYGTSKVVVALAQLGCRGDDVLSKGVNWIVRAQNQDGGWGGDAGVPSSIEETGFAIEALATAVDSCRLEEPALRRAIDRGVEWLDWRTRGGSHTPPSPIGLYFAKLWYFERLYPLIFATAALGRVCRLGRAQS